MERLCVEWNNPTVVLDSRCLDACAIAEVSDIGTAIEEGGRSLYAKLLHDIDGVVVAIDTGADNYLEQIWQYAVYRSRRRALRLSHLLRYGTDNDIVGNFRQCINRVMT